VSIALLQKILQLLLEEGVPIKDLRSILETVSEHVTKTPDPLDILPHVRMALRRTIVQSLYPDVSKIHALGVQPEFERLLEQAMGQTAVAADGVIEPSLMRLLVQEVADGIDAMELKNLTPVIVCGQRTRLTLARIARRVRAQCTVVALNELPAQTILTFERMLCSQASKV
jgi:flagellar biosynthesis protein FlhA